MQIPSITLAHETPADHWEVEALYDLCFSPGRTALSSYRLREDVAPIADLCWTARDPDGVLSGVIRCWPCYVGDVPVVLLGPVAVHPTRQGEGLVARVGRLPLTRTRTRIRTLTLTLALTLTLIHDRRRSPSP